MQTSAAIPRTPKCSPYLPHSQMSIEPAPSVKIPVTTPSIQVRAKHAHINVTSEEKSATESPSTLTPDRHIYILGEFERPIIRISTTDDIDAILSSIGYDVRVLWALSPRAPDADAIANAILDESGGRIGNTDYTMCETSTIDELWKKYVH